MSDVREADADLVLTPRLRTTLRRSLFWIGIVTILALIALVGIVTSQSFTTLDEPLSPDNPRPAGARAVVEVLRDEGVDVTVSSELPTGTEDRTVLVHDPLYLLEEDDLDALADAATTLVLVEPTEVMLEALAPELTLGGLADGSHEADCRVPAARQAEEIDGGGPGFIVDEDADATSCFVDEDGNAGLVRLERDDTTILLLADGDVLRNDRILEGGNAALALGLLGGEDELVWFTPRLETGPESGAPALPGWVLPVSLTAFLVVIAAGVWQGRRFGPLIVENLPVAVRASETMHGRARLYQRSSVRLHALDALRIGTIDRLAKACGLPTLATVDEVVGAVSALTRRPVPEVRHLLVDAVPANDAELVALSDALLTIERAVATAIRPTA